MGKEGKYYFDEDSANKVITFIEKGLVKIEFRNFPLDMAALNASKIAHCRNDGN